MTLIIDTSMDKFDIPQSSTQINDPQNRSLSSSKDFSFQSNSLNSASGFPNVSISIESSEESSSGVESIKSKNLEIIHALSGRISELRKKSDCFLDSFEERPPNTEDFRCKNCFSSTPQTIGVSLENSEKNDLIKEYVCRVKELRERLKDSRKCLDYGFEIIKKISCENEELQTRLGEISCRLDEPEIESEDKGIGCNCTAF